MSARHLIWTALDSPLACRGQRADGHDVWERDESIADLLKSADHYDSSDFPSWQQR
jgi:hypothetical protein